MDEFKSAMLDFLKFQFEQQNRMGQTEKERLEIQKISHYKNKRKLDNKNLKKFYFKLNKSKETCLN